MDEKKICSCCGKENELSNEYCYNCGSFLAGGVAPKMQEPVQSAQYNPAPEGFYANTPITPSNFAADNSEVVSAEEIGRFVGNNGDKILKKFNAMEVSGSKISWCWPAIILTFLFGLVGTGFWFLYRKMTKFGVIFISIGLAMGLVFGFANGTYELAANQTDNIISSFKNVEDFSDVMDAIEDLPESVLEETPRMQAVNSVNNLLDIALAVIFGLFAMGMYKKHCLISVIRIRTRSQNEVMSHAMYSQLGGVSGGALCVGILVYILGSSALESIATLLY